MGDNPLGHPAREVKERCCEQAAKQSFLDREYIDKLQSSLYTAEVISTLFDMIILLVGRPGNEHNAGTDDRYTDSWCCNPVAAPRLGDQATRQLSDGMTILVHPIRLQILARLSGNAGDACVCDLEPALAVKQPTVSHHLKLLREAGLIDCARRQRIGQSLDQLA